MKKMCLFFVIALSFIFVCALQSRSVCEAHDIWVFGNDTRNVYVVSESFEYSTLMEPYTISIKTKVVVGGRYDNLNYIFYTWNAKEYRTSTKWWYYATQYMNREDPALVSTDKSGQAHAILRYCLGRLQS